MFFDDATKEKSGCFGTNPRASLSDRRPPDWPPHTHQRFAFGLKNINELSRIEEKDWEPENQLGLIHSVFPNSSISAIQNQHCLISIVFPTPDFQGTITNQYILCLKEPETDEEIKEAEDFSKLALTAIEDEDYPMNFMIQDSIESKANTEFMFGKNEPIQQHYHHWVDKLSK